MSEWSSADAGSRQHGPSLRVARPKAAEQLQVSHRGGVEQKHAMCSRKLDSQHPLDKHGGLVLPKVVYEAAERSEAEELLLDVLLERCWVERVVAEVAKPPQLVPVLPRPVLDAHKGKLVLHDALEHAVLQPQVGVWGAERVNQGREPQRQGGGPALRP